MKILANKQILITLGPTREPLDPVRYLTNPSSGKMGLAIAKAFRLAGAKVTVIAGPVSLSFPRGMTIIPVETALEMSREVKKKMNRSDVFVAAAAVGDYRAEKPSKTKIKKSSRSFQLKLVRNPDILKEAGLRRAKKRGQKPILVGFALETKNVQKNAHQKLIEKKADLIIGNDPKSFNSGRIRPWWMEKVAEGQPKPLTLPKGFLLPKMTKPALAKRIVTWAGNRFENF